MNRCLALRVISWLCIGIFTLAPTARSQKDSDGDKQVQNKSTKAPANDKDKEEPPVGVQGTQVGTEETPAAAVNTDALRNAAQNPVASLISVPIQENFNFNNQPGGRTQNVLNIQPVIPLSVSKNWNLIVRWITPIIYQPIPVQPPTPAVRTTGVYGLGDMNPSFFLVPKKSRIIWGIGPTFVLPTATNTTYPRSGETQHGPLRRRTGTAFALDNRVSGEQRLVGGRPCQFQHGRHSK